MSNYMGCGVRIEKKNLKEKLLKLETTGEYVAEEKLDGQWSEILVYKGAVIRVLSRTGKEKPFEPLLKYKFAEDVTGIFVGEIGYGSTNSKLRENIAVLYDWVKINFEGKIWKASEVENSKRRVILSKVLSDLKPGILLVERRQSNFFEFYKRVLKEKGEGIIIKKKRGKDTYYMKGTRPENWMKVKKEVEVDMVVMGVDWRDSKDMSKITKDKGMDKLIKHIRCGQHYKGKLREEVNVGSMTEVARQYFSMDNGKFGIGKVVTIRGFEQFQKTGSIRHCSLYKRDDGGFIREDLLPKDCWFGKIKII